MGGFENDVLLCKNMNFNGAAAKPHLGILNAAGKLPIGTGNSSPTPEILGGNLTSPLGTLTIGYSSPNITLDLVGGATGVDSFAVQTGISPVVPNAVGLVTIDGAVVAAGTNPVRSDGTSANTVAVEVQISQALAATDATKIGLSNFDSASFTVDANGFVEINGSGLAETITGDQGGALSPSSGNWTIRSGQASNISGATLYFLGSGSTLTLRVHDSLGNSIIGDASGNLTLSGIHNIGFGGVVMPSLTTGLDNTGVGYASLNAVTTGQANTAMGLQSLDNIIGGSLNVGIGSSAGANYTGSESNNVCIANSGTLGESNVIRLGTDGSGAGQQNKCFVAGVYGVTPSGASSIVVCDSSGQFGTSGSISTTWTDVTGATQALAVGNGYITDRGGGVTYTLPATASLGDSIKIVGKLGITSIAQNANQAIRVSSAISTTGVGGSVVGTDVGDCITLRCTTGGASTIWIAENFVGSWTVT